MSLRTRIIFFSVPSVLLLMIAITWLYERRVTRILRSPHVHIEQYSSGGERVITSLTIRNSMGLREAKESRRLLNHLQELKIFGCDASDGDFELLCRSRELSTVVASKTRVLTNSTLEVLSTQSDLTAINFAENRINDVSALLGESSTIETLNVSHCPLSPESLSRTHRSSLPLIRLYLHGCMRPLAQLKEVVEDSPNLRVIFVSGEANVHSLALACHSRRFHVVSISDCHFGSSESRLLFRNLNCYLLTMVRCKLPVEDVPACIEVAQVFQFADSTTDDGVALEPQFKKLGAKVGSVDDLWWDNDRRRDH